MAYKIEKNIPVPKQVGRRGRGLSYPWDEMQVGDSIFVCRENGKSARSAAYKYGGRAGRKFGASEQDGGMRIWRLE